MLTHEQRKKAAQLEQQTSGSRPAKSSKHKRKASSLKKKWMKMPDQFFVALTFGQLKVNQCFIFLPKPGDNHGHGGFKGSSYIFKKTQKTVAKTETGIPYFIPHGQALNIRRNITSDFPKSMLVLVVE